MKIIDATFIAVLVGGFVAVLLLLIWTELKRRVGGLRELSPAQAVPWPCSPFSDIARCANRRSGAAPCQCIVLGGIITVSPG